LNRSILTIGYTGYHPHDFAAALIANRVQCVLDIREIPLSRKAGFSKSALRDHLKSHGIDYRHFRLLGSPKALRHEVRATGDFSRFFRGVRTHLKSTDSIAQLNEAIEIARQQRCCMMCCCPDWQRCHRKCVVDAILKTSHFAFVHLGRESEVPQRRRAA
jgi:uncharacterized protein (DUF488 family)